MEAPDLHLKTPLPYFYQSTELIEIPTGPTWSRAYNSLSVNPYPAFGIYPGYILDKLQQIKGETTP